MRLNHWKPIRYEGVGAWTVEFANTEDGAAKVFYCAPDAPLDDLNYVLKPGDIHDCRALEATRPIWEAIRDRDPEPDLPEPLK